MRYNSIVKAVLKENPVNRLKRLASAQLLYLKLIYGKGHKQKQAALTKEISTHRLQIERP